MSTQKEFIFGRIPILESLKSLGMSLEKVFILETAGGKIIDEIKSEARSRGVPFQFVPSAKLSRLFEQKVNHQGVAAQISSIHYADLDEIVSLDGDISPIILAMDGVQDVHNLGAIIRTGVAVGASGAIIPRHNAAGITTTVFKTSAGAVAHMPIVRMNLITALDRLKKSGFWILGLSTSASGDIYKTDFHDLPIVVLVGAENQDLSPSLRKRCDFLVKIPLWGQVSSLNVSNATAIALYEIRRRGLMN
ncbi:MAG: 23S rRNA (guanosine(2251)-2'-O)-methyltransferase RlmB [Candidatus Cloacimonetes bacterium 4572_55]|nr:MAG: 23S rRNA (guanosine(2251)-2'-O)-methyltransferase RlmB [Candidatus Cloacimonetes bacterium 4572_55]